MKTLLKYELALIAMLYGSNAFAQFYLDLGLGALYSSTHASSNHDSSTVLFSPTAIGTSLFTLPNVNWENDFKNGFDLNAEFGYQFNACWRSSVEFVYQNIRRKSHGDYGWQEQNSVTGSIYARQANNPISNVNKRANVYSFFTNVTYDIYPESRWAPFLGAGIGVSWLQSGRAQTNNILNIDDPNTPLIETAPATQISPSLYGSTFAWQLKAGISYDINCNTALIIQYRLLGTSRFSANNSVIISNPGTSVATPFYVASSDSKGLLIHGLEIKLRFAL